MIDHLMRDGVRLDAVELVVADLTRSLEHYTALAGFAVLDRAAGRAVLGVGGRRLLVLQERPGARPPPDDCSGLSHMAVRLPSEGDVARFAAHFASHGREFDLGDHDVSLSCYAPDPDGHTLEATCVRPRDRWHWDGELPALRNDAVDLDALLAATRQEGAAFTTLPDDTRLGHVQLKATDLGLQASERFYRDGLGLALCAQQGRGFLGFGTVDLDSLLVLTTRFATERSGRPAGDSARLLGVDLLVPGAQAVAAAAARLAGIGVPPETVTGSALAVRDPSGNLLRFTAQDAA